ncbi:hypothetical protein JXA47_00810, partial [Candidatus Sumerlaeota bacterium]|nr:hypothetical protein [Candidatus Sumerlaeota bacterium]
SEWVPSYLAILLFGRRSLEITENGARNAMTGAGVEWSVEVGEMDRTVTDSLLGVIDSRKIRMPLLPGEKLQLRSTLQVARGRDFQALDVVVADLPTSKRGR